MIESISFDNLQEIPRCLKVMNHFAISVNNFRESCEVENEKNVVERNLSEMSRLKIEIPNSQRQNSEIKGSHGNQRITQAARLRRKTKSNMELFRAFDSSFLACPVGVGPVHSRRASLVRSRQVRLVMAPTHDFHLIAMPNRQALQKTSGCLNVVRNA